MCTENIQSHQALVFWTTRLFCKNSISNLCENVAVSPLKTYKELNHLQLLESDVPSLV